MNSLTVIKKVYCRLPPVNISSYRLAHSELKRELAIKIPAERTRITAIRRRQAKEKTEDPKHGMLGLNNLIWETSEQNDEHELVFRGYSLPQILQILPKLPGNNVPPAEGHFWLLLTGKIPTVDQMKSLMQDWDKRAIVPFYVEKLIREMPANTPPVEQLSGALNTLQSKFVESYTNSGVFKEKYWEMVLEDCMDLIAKVPTIAALIYNKLYRHKMFLPMRNSNVDWASNFALQLGINDKNFDDLMRLFMIVYSDLHGRHFSESTSLGGSALSDPYKSYANGLKLLASNQSGFHAHDHIDFLKKVHDEVGPNPTKQLIMEYLQSRGYKDTELPGFAKLNFKESDPRYKCMLNFAKQHFKDDPLLQLTELVSTAVSETNNTLPNVDAISGLLFYLFGIRDESFFPVMFGLSRSLGLLSSYVWDRALGVPIDKKPPQSIDATSGSSRVQVPSRGTCADFVKSHGASSKLSQGTDAVPIRQTPITSFDSPLKSTVSAGKIKMPSPQALPQPPQEQPQNFIDLGSTVPMQSMTSALVPRFPSTTSLPPPAQSTLPTIPTVLTLSTVSAVPTVSTVSTVPTAPAVHAAPTVPTVATVPTVLTVSTISAVPTVSTISAVPTVSTVSTVEDVPAVETVATLPIQQPMPTMPTPVPQPTMANFQAPVESQTASQTHANVNKSTNEIITENKRHIMLRKPSPVNSTSTYPNMNWGATYDYKVPTKSNQTSSEQPKPNYHSSQIFHKRVGIGQSSMKTSNSTKLENEPSVKTSSYFSKEKEPSNDPGNKSLCQTKKVSSIDFWKFNY